METLQALGEWAAVSAERALNVYEIHKTEDSRPRVAISAIREFVLNGKRTHQLRKIGMDAYRASLEATDPAASAAAMSASLAAASAYTHPFSDPGQGRHILGPAAYSALALELAGKSDPSIGDLEIERAISEAPRPVIELLLKMPERQAGKKRIDQLLYALDSGLRKR